MLNYWYSAIIGWITSKLLNTFFKDRTIEKIIDTYEARLAEKENDIERLTTQKYSKEKERNRIIKALKRSGLSTDKLVEKYDNPLNAILISYATQVEQTKTGYYTKTKFLREELEKYNAKNLGGADWVIPPAKVPLWIKNRHDLESWFEKDILRDRHCKLRYLILFDLKKKAFWKSYVPYTQKTPWNHTIGEVLGVEDLFTENQSFRIALDNIIKEGDIVWLASSVLSEHELDKLQRNQTTIEKNLGEMTLRDLSNKEAIIKLEPIFNELGINNPNEISKAIVEEAKFWYSRLK